jgi:NDP-sugar pyrophosphorylase family protein
MPRGAAGSASDAAIASDGQTFVIAEGTSIPNVDLKALLEKHRTSGACVTVVVHSETRGHLAAVQVPNGIYVFDRRAFDSVPVHGFCDIKETLIPQLYAAGERIIPYEATAATPRVLDAASYMAVNEWMVDHLVRIGEERDGYVKGPNGLVHRDAYIAPDAVIVGPVLIGPGARVLAGAVVVGPTSIGREATLEAGSMVSRSAVWRRATIGGHASADRCLVGDDAVIEEGSHTVSEIISAGRSDVATDWVAQQSVAAARRPAFEVGARIARFVLGASWSGSPAAQ